MGPRTGDGAVVRPQTAAARSALSSTPSPDTRRRRPRQWWAASGLALLLCTASSSAAPSAPQAPSPPRPTSNLTTRAARGGDKHHSGAPHPAPTGLKAAPTPVEVARAAEAQRRRRSRVVAKALKEAVAPELEALQGEWREMKRELLSEVWKVKNEALELTNLATDELHELKTLAKEEIKELRDLADDEIQVLLRKWMSDEGLKTTFITYTYWRSVAEGSRLSELSRELGLSPIIAKRAARALNANIPASTRNAFSMVVNVTAEVVADAMEAPRNDGAPAMAVLHELAEFAEDMDSALHTLLSPRALSAVCAREYHPIVRQLVAVRAAPRLLLTSAAALLCGFDAREDPLLHVLIAAHALEHTTKGMAAAALAAMDEPSDGDGANRGFMGLLAACSRRQHQPSCREIGDTAFAFFHDLSTTLESDGDRYHYRGRRAAAGRRSSSAQQAAAAAAQQSPAAAAAAAALSHAKEAAATMHHRQHVRRLRALLRRTHEDATVLRAAPSAAIVRCDYLTPGSRLALSMARLVRARGRARRARAAARERGAYMWGGLFRLDPHGEASHLEAEAAAAQRGVDAAATSTAAALSEEMRDAELPLAPPRTAAAASREQRRRYWLRMGGLALRATGAQDWWDAFGRFPDSDGESSGSGSGGSGSDFGGSESEEEEYFSESETPIFEVGGGGGGWGAGDGLSTRVSFEPDQ